MIITKEIVKRAEASKSSALDFIKEEEPILFDAIWSLITEHTHQISEGIRRDGATNPHKIGQMAIQMVREIAGMAFIAETIARDTMESKTNQKLMAKLSYQTVADIIENTSGGSQKEPEDTVAAALDEVVTSGKSKERG